MSITPDIPARPPNEGERRAGSPTWGGWLLAVGILLLAAVSFAAGMYVGMRSQPGHDQDLDAAAAQRALIALAESPGGRETAP